MLLISHGFESFETHVYLVYVLTRCCASFRFHLPVRPVATGDLHSHQHVLVSQSQVSSLILMMTCVRVSDRTRFVTFEILSCLRVKHMPPPPTIRHLLFMRNSTFCLVLIVQCCNLDPGLNMAGVGAARVRVL